MNIDQKYQELRKWAIKADSGIARKSGESGDGDSCLWAGLLALSGDWFQRICVEKCVDKNGRIWRAPERIGQEADDTCSRDMFLGFIAYAATSKGGLSANYITRVEDYILQTGKLCPTATDNRNLLTPTIKWMWYIATKGRITPRIGKDLSWMHGLYLPFAALTVPLGYQMHLIGAQVLIRKQLGHGKLANWLTAKLLHRRQPKNILFMLLAGKKKEALAELEIQMPKIEPEFKHHWSLEKSDGEQSYKDSMCWEFLFILNLLKNDLV